METYILTTEGEGDCEGRTSRQLGIFMGSKKQIMQYCLDTGLRPYYSFKLSKSNVIDVSNIHATVNIFEDSYGRITVR